MAFLPDGQMLVGELGGTIRLVLPPYTHIDPTPFLQISNIGRNGVEQGLYDIAIDPNFATNHYITSPIRPDRRTTIVSRASLQMQR